MTGIEMIPVQYPIIRSKGLFIHYFIILGWKRYTIIMMMIDMAVKAPEKDYLICAM